ncbi:hypothetical protein [Amycolatopsis sp. NPDC051128]|uniref:hypothetical protein n=1 Tax=Amycolatopsis sp. NPDC051128 TaxID=3155412 RepID=UPI00343D4659
MKRIAFLVAAALAATGLFATPATARSAPSEAFCVPESITLLGAGGTSICLMAPKPSIVPPFTAFTEQNGSQFAWCLYSEEKYGGFFVRVPAFSQVRVIATFASGRPC